MAVIDDLWTYDISRDGATCIVSLSGEIDMSVSGAMYAVLASEVRHPGTTAVRADLGQVSFLDSAGLHALVRVRQDADMLGCRFTVTNTKGLVAHVLDISGLESFLGACDNGEGR